MEPTVHLQINKLLREKFDVGILRINLRPCEYFRTNKHTYRQKDMTLLYVTRNIINTLTVFYCTWQRYYRRSSRMQLHN